MMGMTMNQDKIKALALELAKDLKTPADLSAFSAQLTKIAVETALNAELDAHLGYAPHEARGRNSGNSRNGSTPKTLKGNHGEIVINTPRDRDASFEPLFVAKGQTRITAMDEQILCLYAKGMSTRDIVAAFQEMYGAEVSASLISKVTNAVMEQVPGILGTVYLIQTEFQTEFWGSL
jgi:transposase-like protein